MKVLIIGGTGLISTAISSQLADRDDEVVLLNRGISKNRVKGKVRLEQGDRNDEAALTALLKKEKPDAVIDMVAYTPSQAEALVRACDGNTPQVVMCSTVCVYGGPLTRLPAKDNEPHRPVSDYGKNKSVIETIVLGRESASQHATVLRPGDTTGEGATLGGLLFDDSTVNRLRQGLPLVVMDDGKAAWAISHISDVATGFVGALGNTSAYGESYHLSSDEHSDWNGVFEAMAEAAGAPGKPVIEHIPTAWLYKQAPRRAARIQNIYQYGSIFDNRKAVRELGFKHRVSLRETFTRQILWMQAEKLLKPVEAETVQTELIAAWREKRDVSPERFEDWNPESSH